jgi:hypothetical protein
MRTLVALWHAFWLSFEIARYQDELQRCCKERTMSRGTILLIVLALVMAAGCSSGLTPEVTAPVEEKPNLVLDDNIKLEYLSAGSMSIVMVKGMVTNKSTSTVGGIEIKFNLFDANGDPIGTAWSYLSPNEALAPGAVWLYQCSYTGEGAEKVTKAVLASLFAD